MFAPDGAKNLWVELATVLTITQSLALMEVLHSFLGLTKSPIMQTVMQVSSRILLVYGITIPSEQAQMHWSLYLMALSWATTEIPRYLFYAFKQAMDKPPTILFHLRYSLFYVLYPTGISGEMLQMFHSLPKSLQSEWLSLMPIKGFPNLCTAACDSSVNNIGCSLTVIILYAYVLGGPFMVFLMHLTRAGAYKKRFPRKRKPDTADGILFPMIGNDRSTQDAGKAVICAAITAGSRVVPVAAAKARVERNWRFGYKKHYKAMVEASLESPEKALAVAKAGIDFLQNTFEFRRPSDKKIVSFKEEMKRTDTCFKGVGVIEGKKAGATKFTVPYKKRGSENPLEGKEVKDLADRWAKYGTIEPDAAEALKQVVDNPRWLDLKNHYFVLIGAGSAMGPFLKLMELGANVIALDIPGAWENPKRPSIWRKLIKVARNSGGKIIFPLSKSQTECKNDDDLVKAAGANLLSNPADLKNWLLNLKEIKDPKNHVVIGNYTYLDSALHVKLSVCADAIMEAVSNSRPKGMTTLAFLCTPTDMHVIPREASDAAEANLNAFLFKPFGAIIEAGMRLVSKKWLKGNVWRTSSHSLVDGLVVNQGPNYALAKRLQHWRAIVAYESGIPVSSNIAPSTATASVVNEITFKWAYGGIPYFKPFEVFDQETTNAVMTAALLYDVRSSDTVAKPTNRKDKVANPLELFKYTSFHGGVWRCGYQMDSLGVPSVLIYFMGGPTLFVPAVVAVTGGLAGVIFSMAM
eukprot:CAMPEP_0184497368 /NCGR_PEP_ID=MMETSP0113_2-20130426/36325_1 /TAXON_ID=91329 /ORGANISM="Norrisiella sphaerica, Strain BC52" /LENGTH=748 /DNA_ID=CAMNT_0026884437 /DNA_START=116 /DNA_END=2362 /DNA_ORIENTATION=+